jgi:hypothetical protein
MEMSHNEEVHVTDTPVKKPRTRAKVISKVEAPSTDSTDTPDKPVKPEKKSRTRTKVIPKVEIPIVVKEPEVEVPIVVKEPEVEVPIVVKEPEVEVPIVVKEPEVEVPIVVKEPEVERPIVVKESKKKSKPEKVPRIILTPEERKERQRIRNSQRGKRVRKTIPIKHCDVCNCDIKWDNMSSHKKSLRHSNNALNYVE